MCFLLFLCALLFPVFQFRSCNFTLVSSRFAWQSDKSWYFFFFFLLKNIYFLLCLFDKARSRYKSIKRTILLSGRASLFRFRGTGGLRESGGGWWRANESRSQSSRNKIPKFSHGTFGLFPSSNEGGTVAFIPESHFAKVRSLVMVHMPSLFDEKKEKNLRNNFETC